VVAALVEGQRDLTLFPRIALPASGEGIVAGDWLWLDEKWNDAILVPRRTLLARHEGGVASKPVAANVDIVFVVAPMDRPLRLSLVERLAMLACDSGASPHVVLTKCDLVSFSELLGAHHDIESALFGVGVTAVSSDGSDGIEELREVLASNQTAVLIGQSGAGKSTLVNRLLGNQQRNVADVRAKDGRGRHTTSASEICPVPGTGSVIIDTAGVRQVAVALGGAGVDEVFADIIDLGTRCRFADCSHVGDQGCAIAASVSAGDLDADRVRRYLKLLRDSERIDTKSTASRRDKSVEYTRFARDYRERRGH